MKEKTKKTITKAINIAIAVLLILGMVLPAVILLFTGGL
jgi:hypothetical protein